MFRVRNIWSICLAKSALIVRQDFKMFEGDAAFNRANEFFEDAVQDLEAFDVWLTRADGAPEGSKFVARVGRRGRGREPEPIPYAENLVDPTESTAD